MDKLQYVAVIGATNFWGGTDYQVIDRETRCVVRGDLGGDRDNAYRIAGRIDAQIAAEEAHGGYLGANQ